MAALSFKLRELCALNLQNRRVVFLSFSLLVTGRLGFLSTSDV